MNETETAEVWEVGALRFRLTYTYLWGESPNDVYGNWEQHPHHVGGTTVALPAYAHSVQGADTTFWVNDCYTPATLAKEYAEQGRANPSKEAYESLQKQLIDDVLGVMLTVSLTLDCLGLELAADHIGCQLGSEEHPDDLSKLMMKEHFNVFALLAEAQEQAATIREGLAEVTG